MAREVLRPTSGLSMTGAVALPCALRHRQEVKRLRDKRGKLLFASAGRLAC
jgi:hypothetical protein